MAQRGAAHPVGTDGVLLGAWADVCGVKRVLDIGTGTGVVALMLAQRIENQKRAEIVGVEPHPPSAALARQNFSASPWAARMQVWEGRIQDYCLAEAMPLFDLIVSN
ncbi:MAG TPA: methyltransferase domain-containing protein, partial [Saprospiraceae bacterium]|nr:methyltransferase domain-containing protein [Saprospiraceae bacterium]